MGMLLLASISSGAQVTIGSDETPVPGAILQLKNLADITDVNANSTKGLGMPRVKLTVKESLKDITGAAGTTTPELYAGLIVYNTNTFCDNDVIIYPGLKVWNGETWEHITNDDERTTTNKDVWMTKDQDGNTFRANRFGDQIWMIDNLAARSYASQSGATVTLPSTPTGVTHQTYENVSFGYPSPNPAPSPLPAGSTGAVNGTDPYYYNNFNEYGLLYTWMAATGSTNSVFHVGVATAKVDQQSKSLSTIGNDEVEKKEAKGYIQGICPDGWHLPSDREWGILTKEFLQNPDKYSYIIQTERALWDTKLWSGALSIHPLKTVVYPWGNMSGVVTYPNNGPNARESNVALAMKRPCDMAFANPSAIRPGRGFLAAEGGFNVYNN